jgi:calcium-dependent protein kinase
MDKVKQGHYTFPEKEWGKITDEAKDLLRKLMEVNYEKRLTAKQALQHEWILRMNEKKFNVELNTDLVSNLKGFNAEHKMSQAAITFLATHMASKKEQ